MGAISLRNVEKTYGRGPGSNKVIHGVNAQITDGEFIVIVGPSGCGKSTLLRMVAGLEDITGGEIDIGGRVVNKLEPAERDIAMVFQNYALYPHMSVYDNMAYGLKIAKQPKAEIEMRVQKAAKILELGTLLQRKPRELSGGQRQRVAMGRAIVRQPAVFLFDEPLSNLDAKLRVQMRAEIAKLYQRLKTTTVYVTHDQTEAMTLAKHIVVMSGGIVQQVGAPLDLYRAPANTFVAGFIGSPAMNFFEVEVSDGRLKGRGVDLPIPPRFSGSLPAQLTLGVRPEHFRTGGGAGTVRMRVDVLEPLGAIVNALCDVEGVSVTATLEPDTRVTVGEHITLGVDLEHVHLFDRASTRAVAGAPRAAA